MKARVLFVFVVLFAFVGTGFQPTQAAESVQVLSDCWRQYFTTWPPDQTVTEFSMFHTFKSGRPAPSCGGVFYSQDTMKFRWYADIGTKCWPGDGCIQNQVINTRPNGKQEVKTTMWTFPDEDGNPRGFYKVAIWNARK